MNKAAHGTLPLYSNTRAGSTKLQNGINAVGDYAETAAQQPGTGLAGPPGLPTDWPSAIVQGETSIMSGIQEATSGTTGSGNQNSKDKSNGDSGGNTWHWYEPWTW